MKHLTLTLLILIAIIGTASADPGDTVVLYQPDYIVGARLGDNASHFAAYILDCQLIWAEMITNAIDRSATALVVGFGNQNKPAGWIVGQNNDPELNKRLTARLRTLNAPAVKTSTVAFAVLGSTFTNNTAHGDFTPPIPKDWSDVVNRNGSPQDADSILQDVLETK